MIYNLETYKPALGESFLFDTNIWIYLYSPVSNCHYALSDAYNRFMWKCLAQECNIYITSLILSEFYNTLLRREFKNQHCKNYKESFRATQEITEEAMNIIENSIMCKVHKLDDSFVDIDLNDIKPEYDFNDYYLVKLCQKNNIKIVTNDSDFKQFEDLVDIIMLDSDYVKKVQKKVKRMKIGGLDCE